MGYPGWPYEGDTKADEVAERLNKGDCDHRNEGTSVCVLCVSEVLAEAKNPEDITAQEVLTEIRESLIEKGVPMEACPPMFYAEAIHNLFVAAVYAGRECCATHGFHNGNTVDISKCCIEYIQRRLARPNPNKEQKT